MMPRQHRLTTLLLLRLQEPSVVQSGCLRFDFDGNLVEDWDKLDKGNRNEMEESSEDGHKRKLDTNHVSAADISISISLSLHAEMTTSNWVQGPIGRLRLCQAISCDSSAFGESRRQRQLRGY